MPTSYVVFVGLLIALSLVARDRPVRRKKPRRRKR